MRPILVNLCQIKKINRPNEWLSVWWLGGKETLYFIFYFLVLIFGFLCNEQSYYHFQYTSGRREVTFSREDIRFSISGSALIILYWNSCSVNVKYQHLGSSREWRFISYTIHCNGNNNGIQSIFLKFMEF